MEEEEEYKKTRRDLFALVILAAMEVKGSFASVEAKVEAAVGTADRLAQVLDRKTDE